MVGARSHREIDESFHVVNKRQEVRNSRWWVASMFNFRDLEIFLRTFLLSRKRKVDVHGQVRGAF